MGSEWTEMRDGVLAEGLAAIEKMCELTRGAVTFYEFPVAEVRDLRAAWLSARKGEAYWRNENAENAKRLEEARLEAIKLVHRTHDAEAERDELRGALDALALAREQDRTRLEGLLARAVKTGEDWRGEAERLHVIVRNATLTWGDMPETEQEQRAAYDRRQEEVARLARVAVLEVVLDGGVEFVESYLRGDNDNSVEWLKEWSGRAREALGVTP